ncbi:glycine cleavage system aminomethyltransferase GcvT [Haladaptatus sp. SPP-AMP-3]|uniref:glycine cleavage system aminomethyltransferase GcvT n=1 Tax=Haladaptatus sp. SPP-AMP-3 TaxID=3121295 RepID=UPI003C30CDEB
MSSHKPPLYQVHQDSGADFTNFGGWEMPVTFDGIRTEHSAVRDSVGIFDVSHMSEVTVSGPDATELMNRLTTNDIRELNPGDAHYSCILNDDGVILDDTVVYQYPDQDGYVFVPNAGNGEKMVNRWSKFAWEYGLTVSVEDKTNKTGLVAVQGPDAEAKVDSVTADSVTSVSRFSCVHNEIAGIECLVARTGYTGEDGFEIFFPANDSAEVWNAFEDIQPCGLGARDTLRLEAGLLLSGQDFDPEDEPRTPLEAGLSFIVDFSKPDFIGRRALQDLKEEGVDTQMVGLKIEDRAIARHGYPIVNDGIEIGRVTSGTLSPIFDVPLALGYVQSEYAERGLEVAVEIRDRAVDATIVNQRFIKSINTN